MFGLISLVRSTDAKSNTTIVSSHQGWTASPDGRGTLDIIWTCVFTAFISCWAILHPAIPPPGSSFWYRLRDRLLCLFVGVLAPEALVYNALVELLEVRALTRTYSEPQYFGEAWTNSHSFYSLMGGFRAYCRPDSESEWRSVHINAQVIYQLVSTQQLDKEQILSEADIQDKGKSDAMIKIVAMVQVLGFTFQCVARRIQKLPLTTLEISTLAYVPCALTIQCLWWEKPCDVGESTLLRGYKTRSSSSALRIQGPIEESVREYDQYPLRQTIFRTIGHALHRVAPVGMVTGVYFLMYGGIHCAAWNLSFASPWERMAWRVSSLVITFSVPFSWLLNQLLSWIIIYLFKGEEDPETLNPAVAILGRKKSGRVLSVLPISEVVQGIGLVLYLLARMYLLVEVFLSLRSLPSSAYSTVNWTAFWPLI